MAEEANAIFSGVWYVLAAMHGAESLKFFAPGLKKVLSSIFLTLGKTTGASALVQILLILA